MITELLNSDIIDCANLINESYQDSALYRFAIADEKKRAQVCPWLFHRVIESSWERIIRFGIKEGEELEACSLWFPPSGSKHLSLRELIECGLYKLPLKIGANNTRKLLSYTHGIRKLYKKTIKEDPGYFLYFMAVKNTTRCNENSYLVLDPILRAKRQHPCYTLTHNEQVLDFYKRVGFELIYEDKWLKNGPKVYLLRAE